MTYKPLGFGTPDGGNVTFGASGSLVTATAPAGGGGGGVALSAGTVAITSGTAVFSNANGVTFGANGQTVTASVAAATAPPVAFSASGGSSTFATLPFLNSFGMSFSNSNGSVVLSHNKISNINLSAGTHSQDASAFTFANANGVSFGLNAFTMTASHNGLTSQSAQALSAGNGSFAFQTAAFANGNGVSFSTTTGSAIIASHNGLTSQSNQAFSAANGSATFQTLSFANSNGVSFSTGTQGVFASYTVPSTAGLLSAVRLSAGTSSANLGAMTFSNSNGVSFGLNGSVVTASVNAGGGGVALAAGTQTATSGTISFANSNGVTFGMSGSNQITASVNAGGGAGPTVSMHPATPWPWATSTMYSGASTTTAGGFRSTLSMYVAPFVLPAAVTFNDVAAIVNAGATAAGTGSGSNRHVYGIYTRTGSTLSLLTEFGFNAVHSQSSVTAQTLSFWAGAFAGSTAASTSRISGNVSASISGSRLVRFNATSSASSLSAGQYFLANIHNARTTGSALFNMSNAWRYSVSQFTAVGFGFSNTTGAAYCECNGIASSTVTAANIMEFGAPASIHLTAITATGGTSQNQWPLVILRSVTA